MRVIRPLLAASGATIVTLALAASPAQAAGLAQVTGTRVATATPTSSAYTLLEGGATDGRYWYSAVLRNTYHGSKIYYSSVELLKTPLNGSRPTLTVSYPLRSGNNSNLLGHANDMAYNSDTKQLVVPTNQYDSSKKFANQNRTLRIVDPRTLKIVRSVTVAKTTTAICYDAVNNRYLGRNGTHYYIYNTAFTLKGSFTLPANAMVGVPQGIDCDQSYVYVIRTPDKTLGKNRIYAFTWKGAAVKTYEYNSTAEGEELLHSGGTYYEGYNIAAGQLYRLDKFQYTVHYAANHGTGSMAPTVVLYGHSTPLRRNSFTRHGYRFVGWTAQRSVDGDHLYTNPKNKKQIKWCQTGKQPSGWILSRYGNAGGVAKTAPRGNVTMTAIWAAA